MKGQPSSGKLKIVNRFLRKLVTRGKLFEYRYKRARKMKNFVELSKPLPAQIENKHRQLWSNVHSSIDLSYLRQYAHLSGIPDHRYVPQDLYIVCIVPAMNHWNWKSTGMDKCRIQKLIGSGHYPQTLLFNMAGTFMDSRMRIITQSEAEKIYTSCQSDLFVKPSIDSGGGKNIIYLKFRNGTFENLQRQQVSFSDLLQNYNSNFLIQKKIIQHSELAKFHPASVNTVRMHTYRSIRNEKIHFFKSYLLIGKGGNVISNTRVGGMYVDIDEDGNLGRIGVDKNFDKSDRHPDTGIAFEGTAIPQFKDLKALVEMTALKMSRYRLIAFDCTLDLQGNPIIIEINLGKIGIEQTCGGPLMGAMTEEFEEDFQKMKIWNDYQIIRT